MNHGFLNLFRGDNVALEFFLPFFWIVDVYGYYASLNYFSICCRALFNAAQESHCCAKCVLFCGSFSSAIASYFLLGPMCALIWVFKFWYCMLITAVFVS